MWTSVRGIGSRMADGLRAGRAGRKEREPERPRERPHNLFEAAAVYVSACAEDDRERMDEAAGWVSPEALSFGVNELACRAVVALARERDESPGKVARALLGLPAA
ncbi:MULTISPECIES: hypothetical protein [Streptomyces]|jgi:hypothetical protein|uniref:Uncharacterized protein n=2 Tax=Streptomyces TaxID=1883 RepID=A0A514K2Z1_9ACTN|nr:MULTISPECIES: hypothetical protein [Streptomyces]MBA8944883.1 hypothetical protein [Streptomyces calvus]MBA8979461.1 hypothetical protein [Streptomyces calvus]MYS30751.1 hypothetical protein [Streptomyces sp. SID7804]QDI73542.1 hypothetical protein CD934_29800 [Streptomyces calvus]